MKKRWFVSFLVIVIFIFISFYESNENIVMVKEVEYNGTKLLVSIDGNNSNTLPTSGTYYLTDYSCNNVNTEISWDKDNYKLKVSNGTKKAGVACNLEFKSSFNLNEVPVGSYVKYVGDGGIVGNTNVACQVDGDDSSSTESAETEAPNSCSGQNAREDLDDSGYSYGYCYLSNFKYLVTGWRVAYIDSAGKPVIVSAGSPECNTRESSTANESYIKLANTKALKYCNKNFVDGSCNCVDSDSDGYCDSASSDAWAINDTDFYYMTKAISVYGKRLTSGSSSLGDSGGTLGTTLYCVNGYSIKECGYGNDLIDNGGYYWFASRYTTSSTYGTSFEGIDSVISSSSYKYAYGLRPVISLAKSVKVTGGSGTMEDPYVIGNNSFSINGGSRYISSNDDVSNVTLSLVGMSDVETMCISVGSSECNNYVDFASTYSLDWSSLNDGEKVVYVYYKNASGEIVASISKSIILDTEAPSSNSISIGSDSGYVRTLTLSSNGADYMCFSNTSNNASDCTNWISYSTSYTGWRLSDGEGSKTVFAFFKDEAGNVGNVASGTVTVTIECLAVNSSYSLEYTGSMISSSGLDVKLCAGTYTLQLWGAQGGNTGGNGGYSTGDVTLAGTESLYFYVGGAGDKGTAGFNGGGAAGNTGGGGGGATDVRIGSDSLLARVIVAGGGGGKGQDSCAAGGAGGGTSGVGGASQGNCGTQGGAGTQTTGGAVGVYSSTNGSNEGTFGAGGAAADASYDGGGGGGGWYGGGAGASASWSNGGGGGSGFVYTASATLPTGYLLTSTYYLANASTVDGEQTTIPTVSGSGTETGHAGNGFIKITRLS